MKKGVTLVNSSVILKIVSIIPQKYLFYCFQLDNFDENDLYDSTKMQKPRIKKKLVSVKQKILGTAHFECHIVPIGDPKMKVHFWLCLVVCLLLAYSFGYV